MLDTPATRPARPWSRLFVTAALLVLVTACSGMPTALGPGSGTGSGTSTASGGGSHPSTPAPAPVVMTPSVQDKATQVTVDTLVSVKASEGSLSAVKISYTGTDSKGRKVAGKIGGKLNSDKSAWQATDRLEPSATYTVAMKGVNASNSAPTKTTTTFTTQRLSLSQQTFPSLYPLKGSEVGIGMPITLNLDVPVKDKAAIEKNLHVTTTPAQTGSWRWFSDTQVRYRPAKYWKPGTKVTVAADINGVKAGNGVYGQNDASTSFTVGRSMIIKVNLATDYAEVYRSGQAVRHIAVTGGRPGWLTRSGTKIIMAKEYNKVMTNEMIGAKEKYKLTAPYAMRITNSGEFLHAAPWSLANLGVRNHSHGCTGMSNADAGWLIRNSLLGDVVITTGTSRGMELDNGYGDWNISYAQYKKGSAL
jgi:lipoprotein-anchoring transpeptidase ErfK/SrfK